MWKQIVSMVLAVVLMASACGSGEDASTAASSTTLANSTSSSAASTSSSSTSPTTEVEQGDSADDETSTTQPATTSEQQTTTTQETPPPPDVVPVDWLTVAAGVTISAFDGEMASASNGVRAIDGEFNQIGFSNDTAEPVVYVFELPAPTTFTRFAVPATRNSPGNTTFFGAIEIAGSAASADEGFEVLVDDRFVELDEDAALAEFIPSAETPVRWLRLTLSGALVVEHEPGRTVVGFTELIGNGTQEDVELEDGFNGVWELAFLDNPDGSGELTELHQDGARVSGCVGFANVSGTVTGNVARLIGVDTRDERPSAYLFTVGDDGRLRGMESTNNGVFRSRIGRVAPEGTGTPCSDTEPEPLACGAVVYVNFDVNSATIRPDSTQVLDDLFEDLSELGGQSVTVIGHTSTEGETDYNQSLSERRAAAVVDELIDRGIDSDRINSEGRGESEPLVSETDEASRALNRRVEIGCG